VRNQESITSCAALSAKLGTAVWTTLQAARSLACGAAEKRRPSEVPALMRRRADVGATKRAGISAGLMGGVVPVSSLSAGTTCRGTRAGRGGEGGRSCRGAAGVLVLACCAAALARPSLICAFR
jgi:hypothetical protein